MCGVGGRRPATFAGMKKSTIWAVAIVMGVSFLALLYLQASYFEEVIDIRKEQFDAAVTRSLYRTARTLELEETKKGLEAEARRKAAASAGYATGGERDTTVSLALDIDGTGADTASAYGAAEKQPTGRVGVAQVAHKGYFLNNPASSGLSDALRDSVRQRYVYQRSFLDEVVCSILYKAGDKPLAERVDFRELDSALRSALKANGVSINYHFYVTTSDGRCVYKCPDYTSEGDRFTYRQILYPNDPAAQTGLLYIHFPDMPRYIFSSVRFMLPALAFTVVLLVVFVFTIYTIFRQKRLSEIKNDFINNMTHEFKTPISTISLAAQMLGDPSVAKNDKMFAHISGVIVDETKRLRFQVEKVLQMSMFDRKAATFKRREADANALIQDTVNTFRLKVEASGGRLDAALDAENAIVFVDEMHFTNVVFNLMDNAVKYRAEDRPLQLSVSTRNEGGKLLIVVEDNGIGIRRDDLKKIFGKFYRVHTGNRHDVKGFGLGLAYVSNVVRAHGGRIHAESDFGHGTRFVITLPLMA